LKDDPVLLYPNTFDTKFAVPVESKGQAVQVVEPDVFEYVPDEQALQLDEPLELV